MAEKVNFTNKSYRQEYKFGPIQQVSVFSIGLLIFFGGLFVLLNSLDVKANPLRTLMMPTMRFPFLNIEKGTVYLTGKDEIKKKIIIEQKKGNAEKQFELIEYALIQTSSDSIATIELDNLRKVVIQSDSELEIPSISRESGEAPYLKLNFGSIFWKQDLHSKSLYPVTIRSNLYEQRGVPGSYLVRYKPESPYVEVLVIQGQIDFTGLHNEESVLVKEGQKAKFTGVLEAGEIAYDLLLKGKKVARGTISPVENLTAEEKESYSLDRERREQEKAAEIKKTIEKKKNELKPGQICRKPNAKFNQCAWICLGNPADEDKRCRLELSKVKCQRLRCNANGVWSGPEIVSKSEAKLKCLHPLKEDATVSSCE